MLTHNQKEKPKVLLASKNKDYFKKLKLMLLPPVTHKIIVKEKKPEIDYFFEMRK